MKILLTNDDGVNARGIRVLKEKLSQIAEVKIVAPDSERSVCGHGLTLRGPLFISEVEQNIWGCSGYPADCVYWALTTLYNGQPPDLVISGINRGANLGQDTYYSGTVAGAREATFHGVRAVALSTSMLRSQIHNYSHHLHYEVAADYMLSLIEKGVCEEITTNHFLNINVPNCERTQIQGVELATVGFRKYSNSVSTRVGPSEQSYFWITGQLLGDEQIPQSDCVTIENNKISVSLINVIPKSSDNTTGLSKIINWK
ncbi:MAG: 5'/3'-nucleotidase SurE [Bdellovibrionales bacterium RIFOXYD12_FULL_39_22]|nr:MAG: 5'/3'-nucleotidase SurE [Bdellovibrionales bacterium RIFOXYB1_FULL_39_21]OFZ45011.1 MAG: 5'/3'-nucleotidase SurE [Bdellovibrionales bacterium RIFOXYC12_FULL_39_17]OFZ49449.1 MAG: 5'/3'-nucleotidase SurE [Bdellovibrionales bacterium RIFOXYC1_FULL_39_130]OFZ77188.1 MAG: 5'/3'-nucleotidase SurE [Bdellovibrionales bacterium RIFOXYD1_FULL_39_84]OFZ95633.1 MAG: 5'/3'-nucleotidase SurE [Bdellovibrionales bacterium RIFOXYD12_FULL_39_22]HLE11147.1 5'/3'-nucleotidase SurE [Bacteriovoracaceae bac